MQFIIDHWFMILAGIILIANAVFDVYKFYVMPREEQIEKLRGWLLQAVILAEAEFGSKTGQLKLSAVYAKFCKEMPWLAQLISFERFAELVDEALERMRNILSTNKCIAAVVDGKSEVVSNDA